MKNFFPLNLYSDSGLLKGLAGLFALVLLVLGTNLSAFAQFTESHQDTIFSVNENYYDVRQYGDFSVEDLLLRYVGSSAGERGEINFRGVGFNRYNVTVDGFRLASSGFGDRSYDLAGIPVDLFYDVNWVRILSPDMDADALAGTVNLRTNSNFAEGRNLTIRAGGGANPYFFRLSGPMGRGSIHYSDRIREDLSLNVNLSYQQDSRGWEGVQTQFDAFNFGDGPVDVIERVSPFVETTGRERLGGTVNLQYRPEENQRYYLNAFFNNHNIENVRHFDAWNANGDWISREETGQLGGRGSYQQVATLQEVNNFQHMVQLGGNPDLGYALVDYSLGWSRSYIENARYEFPFVLTGRNMDIDMENRDRPSMVVNNFNLQADGSIDRQFMVNQNFERLVEDHTDNRVVARVDVSVPLGITNIKAGFASSYSNKSGNVSDASLQFVRILRLNRFNFLAERNFEILDNSYDLPWLLNTEDARRFTESQRPQFNRNENIYRMRSEVRNYEVTERIQAGYGMAEFKLLAGLKLSGGLRIEASDREAFGTIVEFSQTGAYITSRDTSTTTSSIDLFPNLNLMYNYGQNHSLHIAYSKSIQRPDYNLIAPFELSNIQQQLIYAGNPELEPVYSDNIDLFYALRLGNGRIGTGLFSKQISNFVQQTEEIIEGGDFDQWTRRTFVNSSNTAHVYGFELSFHQHLTFLPGFLGNFGTLMNYTWVETSFESEERDSNVRLPGHSPHVFNGALNYSQGRFFLQLTYHWSAENLTGLAAIETLAPSINTTDEVYMDEYRNGWKDMSLSATFRISDQFKFWIDANNLLTPEYVRYQFDRDLYPVSTEFRAGRSFLMGIRFDM